MRSAANWIGCDRCPDGASADCVGKKEVPLPPPEERAFCAKSGRGWESGRDPGGECGRSTRTSLRARGPSWPPLRSRSPVWTRRRPFGGGRGGGRHHSGSRAADGPGRRRRCRGPVRAPALRAVRQLAGHQVALTQCPGSASDFEAFRVRLGRRKRGRARHARRPESTGAGDGRHGIEIRRRRRAGPAPIEGPGASVPA